MVFLFEIQFLNFSENSPKNLKNRRKIDQREVEKKTHPCSLILEDREPLENFRIRIKIRFSSL